MLLEDNKAFKIEKLVLGQYETNAYILVCKATGESLVVDAPAETNIIIERLQGTTPKLILLTHDHYDHTGVMTSLRSRLKVPLATHKLSSLQLKTPPEILLNGGEAIQLGHLKLDVLFTPGHTSGSLCFRMEGYLFTGDTLFPGGPGHTDTPEDFKQIIKSITEKIYRLSDATVILPGHGDSITIKESKAEYRAFASKIHDEAYGDVTWLG